MLETRDLRKIYKPKKGVPVTALDGVSLLFPERGMVFLLGKSGSGKSTLLNVLGGLDKYDGGEIIIKGVSSRDFTQTRFDSYRNTYIGFIFQDYNVLEEFTVGANIALALELQGKRADDDEINRILKEVDLVGYGNRKPNELSGGQLQRVAIARALVKNPEIIMADEPTGALDSNTGKQVFDTLKRLSKTKLVIIVSHDREYAEHYADRIIELADGRVISDVEYSPLSSDESPSLVFTGDTISVPANYHLSEADRLEINEYIDRVKSGTKLHFSGLKKKFTDTDTTKIKRQDGSAFKLIKSKLPMKSAFRIGGSSLKHKKFRLVVTIFLSVVAFTLFALVDTFSAYNHVKTCTNSIIDSGISYASVIKAKKFGDGINSYWRTYGYKLGDEEIAEISEKTGVKMKGVYVPRGDISLDFQGYIDGNVSFTESSYDAYAFFFSGFTDIAEEDLDLTGYTLAAGKLPTADNEIAISSYVCETFIKGGFLTGFTEDADGVMRPKYDPISSAADMVGRTLSFGENDYVVSGIIDTHFDLERYLPITESSERDSTADTLVKFFLYSELSCASEYSLNCVVFTAPGATDKMIDTTFATIELSASYAYFYSEDFSIDPYRIGKLSDLDPSIITWVDGESRSKLGEKEIIVSTDCVLVYDSFQDYKQVETGDISSGDIDLSEVDWNELFKSELSGRLNSYISDGSFDFNSINDWRVVGYIDSSFHETDPTAFYTSDSIYDVMTLDATGDYRFAVGAMPDDRVDIEHLVEYCYNEETGVRYEMQNSVAYELDTVHEVLTLLSSVFLWIGVGFAGFASAMLANFIATSIAYKKQEIGILRAIGSRSNDVFRIFFSEAFIIAMINFVLSAAATLTITILINIFIRKECGILITILTFDIRQIVLLLALSVGIAAVSSFLPVKKIASKRPIDAIRGR